MLVETHYDSRRSTRLVSLWAGCCLFFAAPGLWAGPRAAFVGLDGLGLDTSVVHPFNELVQETMTDILGGNVLTPTEVAAHLTTPGLGHLQACGGDANCLADLGGVLETPFVVYGTLTRLGEHHVISLRAINIESGEIRRSKRKLAGERKLLIQTLRELVTRVLSPDQFTGQLIVAANEAGATATLDGRPFPLSGEPVAVPAGSHTLVVQAPEHRTVSNLVEIRLDETTRVEVVLESTSLVFGGDASQWWPFATMGVGAVGLASAGTLGILTAHKEGQVEDNYMAGLKQEKYYARQDRDGRALAMWTNITLAVGSALLTTGLVGWLFADEPSQEAAP